MAFVLLLCACSKAPSGIIKESKMSRVLADLAVAEAYLNAHGTDFPDDSTKLVFKQSVLAKHGVTLEDYDKALGWYAHNVDVYIKVHNDAIGMLDERQKELLNEIGANGPGATHGSAIAHGGRQNGGMKKRYDAKGDTTDLWTAPRAWMLTAANGNGYIPFDIKRNSDFRNGDKLQLDMKLLSGGNKFVVFLAADYADGTTTYASKTAFANSWCNFVLQTDNKRHLSRLYGYIYYDIKPHTLAFIDSVSLLRTRYNANQRALLAAQRIVGPKKAIEKAADSSDTDDNTSGQDSAATQQEQGRPSSAIKIVPPPNSRRPNAINADSAQKLPPGHYKPKEGLNKQPVKFKRPSLGGSKDE